MSHVADRFEPQPDNQAIYQALYNDVYKKMYRHLKPTYKAIRSITGYPT
jgi:sugar (pentulose or hexulose) kinase